MCVVSNMSRVFKGALVYIEHISVLVVSLFSSCSWVVGRMPVVTSNEMVRRGCFVWKKGNRGRGAGGRRVGMMTICMVEFGCSGDQHSVGCGRLAIEEGVVLYWNRRVWRGRRGGSAMGTGEFDCRALRVSSCHVVLQWGFMWDRRRRWFARWGVRLLLLLWLLVGRFG